MATLYTTLDAARQPVNLIVGQAFRTSWIRILTPEDAAWSLTPVGDLFAMEATHPAQCLEAWGVEDRARWCIEVQEIADPVVIPTEVSRLQAKQVLLAQGLLGTVDAAVAQAGPEVQLYYAEASHFHRDHPALIAMTDALAMTPEQVDALFIAAAQIT